MNIALERIESPVRIVPSQPLSLEEFWQFSADNRDLRLEREPNGNLLVMTPALGGVDRAKHDRLLNPVARK